MILTGFGIAFIPLSVAIFLFRPPWLGGLLIVAAAFQSPAVVQVAVGGALYGITPFNLVALLIGADLLRIVWREGWQRPDGEAGAILAGWYGYAAAALLGVLFLPHLFAEMPVYAMLDKAGADGQLAPLGGWTLVHAAQAVNLLLMLMILTWVSQQNRDGELPRRLLAGFVIALIATTLVGLQQRLAWNGLMPLWEELWASNPSYAQNYVQWAGPVPRVSWPFTEPAYSSAWYAALFGGCITLFLAGRRTNLALIGSLLAGFALTNSLGATGIVAILLFLLLALVVVAVLIVRCPELRGALIYRVVQSALVTACVVLASYLVLRHYGLVDVALSASRKLLEGNNPTVWGDIRPHANQQSWQLLIETMGLGVGLGGHRSSSYLASLLANTGAIGTLLFLFALGRQFYALRPLRGSRPSGSGLFLLGGGIAGTIAVFIAIPDQNWPAYWVWLIAGYAWIACRLPEKR